MLWLKLTALHRLGKHSGTEQRPQIIKFPFQRWDEFSKEEVIWSNCEQTEDNKEGNGLDTLADNKK